MQYDEHPALHQPNVRARNKLTSAYPTSALKHGLLCTLLGLFLQAQQVLDNQPISFCNVHIHGNITATLLCCRHFVSFIAAH